MPLFSNYNRCRPTLHHATHEVGGIDEVAGIAGTFTGRNGFDYTLKTDGTDIIAYDDEGTQVGSTRQDLAVLIETDLLPLKTTAAIKLTSGTFPLKTKLTLSKNFGLYGNGMHNTVIEGVSNVADAMLELTENFIDIQNLHLDGGGHFAIGLLTLAAGFRVYDVQVSNTTGNGMTLGNGSDTFTGGYIVRPRLNPTCLGHELEITLGSTDIWVTGGNFRGYLDTNSCLKINDGMSFIHNNHFWGRRNLIYIGDTCFDLSIQNNWIDDSYRDGIYCNDALCYANIIGNHFRWNGHMGNSTNPWDGTPTYGNIYCNNHAFYYNVIADNNFLGSDRFYSVPISEYAINVITTGTYNEVVGNSLRYYNAASGSRLVFGGAGNDLAHNMGA